MRSGQFLLYMKYLWNNDAHPAKKQLAVNSTALAPVYHIDL